MEKYIYSGLTPDQAPLEPDEEALMDELGQEMMSSGNVSETLGRMQQDGFEDEAGRKRPGINDLLEQLRDKKQRRQNAPDAPSGDLQDLERLEKQLEDAKDNAASQIDKTLLKKTLGNDAARDLERLVRIPEKLDKAGYISRSGSAYKLTPRGQKRIGQKALQDIFAQLRRTRATGHHDHRTGSGGPFSTHTKKYTPGDSFNVHPQKTIINAVYREPGALPVRISPQDFEVFQRRGLARSATVLMLDLSFSMPARGHFEAAKRVAVALDSLIRTQYPKDSLSIVGFSNHARQIQKEDLSAINWGESDKYTNMQHGLYLARKILAKEHQANKHIILVTDGEPTAHFEDGDRFFCQVPPCRRTIDLTLREVRNCTKERIVINTFMLENNQFLTKFVTKMAQINRGRVFFTSAETLGQYLIVDYLTNKKREITPY